MKIPVPGVSYFSKSCWPGSPRRPHIIKVIATAVDWMPEVGGRTFCWIHCTLRVRTRRNQAGTDLWAFPSCWRVFTVLEGAMQATGGELSHRALFGYGPCILLCYQHATQAVPAGAIASWTILGTTSNFLIRFKARSMGGNSHPVLLQIKNLLV